MKRSVKAARRGPVRRASFVLSRRIAAVCVSCVLSLAPAPADAAPNDAGDRASEKPWRLHEAAGAPSWLRFALEQRTRFEHLASDFRATTPGDSSGLLLRTLFAADVAFAPVVVGGELQDSRVYASDATPLNATLVNPLEILQAYVALRGEDVLTNGDAAALTLGRFTLDVGSRRLLARNEFRNTINSFTGVDVQWTTPGQHLVRCFVVSPVVRAPSDAAALADNRVELDWENTDAVFGGVLFGSAPLALNVQIESYAFALHERDREDAPSTNRRLIAPGFRLLRAQAPGRFDFQLEAMVELGTSRSSSAPEAREDLSHRALSTHASVGYRFDAPWSPRVALQHDFASGDGDPNDTTNGRFDPLFGARRFDFGPTGLYGAFARSNVNSPGLRVEFAPAREVEAMMAYRLFWLASRRDAWTTAGVSHPAGASGSFVGHQLEARIRLNALPKNLVVELGGAYLVRGAFAETAYEEARPAPWFGYTQVTGFL